MPGIKGRSGGHNKKTLRERQLLGVKKSRRCDTAPDYLPARIDKIEGLGEIGTTIWNRYEPMLHNNGTLSESDGMAFFGLCKKWEMWYTVNQEVDVKGKYLPVKDKEGNVIGAMVAPWAKLEVEYFSQLQVSMRQFGLTPVDRGNVERITREKKVNKFAGLT